MEKNEVVVYLRVATKEQLRGDKMSEGRKAPRDRGAKSPITAARLAAGMTQGQLAEAIGCTQKDISRWERGVYSPRVDVLAKMAEVLGCSIDELISKGQD